MGVFYWLLPCCPISPRLVSVCRPFRTTSAPRRLEHLLSRPAGPLQRHFRERLSTKALCSKHEFQVLNSRYMLFTNGLHILFGTYAMQKKMTQYIFQRGESSRWTSDNQASFVTLRRKRPRLFSRPLPRHRFFHIQNWPWRAAALKGAIPQKFQSKSKVWPVLSALSGV